MVPPFLQLHDEVAGRLEVRVLSTVLPVRVERLDDRAAVSLCSLLLCRPLWAYNHP